MKWVFHSIVTVSTCSSFWSANLLKFEFLKVADLGFFMLLTSELDSSWLLRPSRIHVDSTMIYLHAVHQFFKKSHRVHEIRFLSFEVANHGLASESNSPCLFCVLQHTQLCQNGRVQISGRCRRLHNNSCSNPSTITGGAFCGFTNHNGVTPINTCGSGTPRCEPLVLEGRVLFL